MADFPLIWRKTEILGAPATPHEVGRLW